MRHEYMTNERRTQRRKLLFALLDGKRLTKPDAGKIIGVGNMDAWLVNNVTLPIAEDDAGRLFAVRLTGRKRGEPLIRTPETNGVGGSHAVRG